MSHLLHMCVIFCSITTYFFLSTKNKINRQYITMEISLFTFVLYVIHLHIYPLNPPDILSYWLKIFISCAGRVYVLRWFYSRWNVSGMLQRHRFFLLLHMHKSFVYWHFPEMSIPLKSRNHFNFSAPNKCCFLFKPIIF